MTLTYRDIQLGGGTIKPIHYHIGEWLAITHFFTSTQDYATKILDLGCGIGYGVGIFNRLGYKSVIGVDLNPEKIEIGKSIGYNIICDDFMSFDRTGFDIIWSSHSFEHMENPELALGKLLEITRKDAKFYFILPYPDLEPAPAHCASKEIGLSVDDNGASVARWFEERGLFLLERKQDKFREPEIWLKFEKK